MFSFVIALRLIYLNLLYSSSIVLLFNTNYLLLEISKLEISRLEISRLELSSKL